ncbi:MAG: hypothetical protein LBU79_07820, partial [Planctomycetota bacterium]|nr:hypothetical protein [Planctomycetota bacterium]
PAALTLDDLAALSQPPETQASGIAPPPVGGPSVIHPIARPIARIHPSTFASPATTANGGTPEAVGKVAGPPGMPGF